MKILLINTVPTDKNGITNVLFNYLRAMNMDDLQIDLVTINQPDEYYVKEVEKKGGQLFVLPRLNRTVMYWRSLRDLIRRENYNAVHIHGNSHTTVLELTAAKAAGCDVRIVHAHTTKCMNIGLHKLLSPLFYCLCTKNLACGVAAGKFMFGNRPFCIVNNGIDTDKFAYHQEHRDYIRNKYNWNSCKVIGHVGYFSEVKNHRWIIEVFREIVKRDKSFRLVLIGDGELREEIVETAKEYEILDNISFTGNINNVDEYLSAIDVILMPSFFEGLPLSLIEQQANGLRCVVSDSITAEVDITGNIKFLSLSLSAKEWADEIVNIKTITDEERKRISDCANYAVIKCGYSIKEEAEKIAKIYYSIK